MKRYHDLTREEKLALTQDEFYHAVKIEGIERGIKPPITLDNAIAQFGWSGFTIPPDSVMFYEIVRSGQYSTREETGVCFKTAEEARRAIQNAVAIINETYPHKKRKIVENEFTVQEVYVSFSSSQSFAMKLEEFTNDTKDFDELTDECAKDLAKIRQDKYDREVALRKRAEYVALANGDEQIARAFWAKTERTEFPEP